SGFTDDGYCSEGIGYWSYGFGHQVLLAETVAAATGGRLRLLQGAKLERVNAFPTGMEITTRVYPAFSDNAPTVQPAVWVAPLARRALDGGTAPARLPAPGWTEIARDQLYLSAVRAWAPSIVSAAGAPEPELRHWFDEAQVLVARAANDFGAAIKGGHNDELHNHNDLGSFVLALGATALIVDPGSEVYTARTFSARRYESNVLNSYGHGVPIVAGRLQSTGRAFAARVLATDWSRERDRLLLDLKGAYEVPALLRLEREFVCRRGTAEGFTITDEFEFSSPHNFGTALITFFNWRPIGSNALEIGTGAERVFVRLESDGGPVTVRTEVIEEDLPAGRRPVRLGLEFTQPVVRGRIRVHVTRAVPLLPAPPGAAGAPPARLHNLSTLGAVRGGEGSLIAGFTIAGPGRRSVLLRAVGPGLAPFGVAGALGNPALILRNAAGEFARNDNWSGAAVAGATAAVGAFPLAAGSADAALLIELTAGAYTAQVEEPGGGTGGVLAELYDAGGGDARLVNLSTRGHVPAGSPLTLGLSVGPGEPRWFLLRGVGPALAQFGLANALPDPRLEVFSGGTRVGANDDWNLSYWSTEVTQAARAVQAFPLPPNSADAAVLV
ncbi:MAG: hypothetical protein FJ399_21585, partial [Verrucomicrobia bacterium]|nr:hypothetical protein [Verrucomicrobiota bacterium]